MKACPPNMIADIDTLGSFPAVYQQLDSALNDPHSSIGRFGKPLSKSRLFRFLQAGEDLRRHRIL